MVAQAPSRGVACALAALGLLGARARWLVAWRELHPALTLDSALRGVVCAVVLLCAHVLRRHVMKKHVRVQRLEPRMHVMHRVLLR